MTKTITIPKVPFGKVLKRIVAQYPKEAVKVSIVDYDYIIEADSSIITEIIGVTGTEIHYLQQVQDILREDPKQLKSNPV